MNFNNTLIIAIGFDGTFAEDAYSKKGRIYVLSIFTIIF